MSFKIKNDSGVEVDSLFSFHNGFTGEPYIVKFFLESEDEHQGVEVEVNVKDNYAGWSIKIAKGHTLLSEEEWDSTEQIVNFDEFGNEQELSCRVYCPGGTISDIYNPFTLAVRNA
tara:strand:+ start:759 stop:1106 length:348 start_codon:yes stop_codon:yes gene_type:complete